METLGEKIKQLRKELTQEELATILQVDRSTVASWEINRREPDIQTLCRIADFFSVSVDWLVGYRPRANPSSGKNDILHETQSGYPIIPDDAWHKVIAVAQSYGYTPDAVRHLLEANAKIAFSLKKGGQGNDT